jgi:hypothetical protein
MTDTPSGNDSADDLRAQWAAERRAADERYAGTAMRRYSQMYVSLSSPWLRTDKAALQYLDRENPAHPPRHGDGNLVGERGWGGGHGWDRLRTPEALASPVRFRSRARKAGHLLDILSAEFLGTIPVVSEQAAALMREFDAGAVDTYPVEVTLATGEVLPEGSFHLLDVTRDIPAVDIEASGWRWVPGWDGAPRPQWKRSDGNSVPIYILRDEMLPEDVHLFRDRRFFAGGPIWVSNAVREAMTERGITGPGFAWGDRDWHTMRLVPPRFRGRV